MSVERCMEMILSGEITDGKTIVAMLFAEKYLIRHG
jgi:ADP-ribose pyrophosphatase